MIFVQFDDDILDYAPWPINSLPDYNEVFYANSNQFHPTNDDLSLSNFYYQMSKHSVDPFKIYGEAFPEVIKIPTPTSADFAVFASQVFDSITAISPDYPNFDWASFDQRTNNPNYQSNNVNSSPDGIIDYVVLSYRWNNKQDPWSPLSAPTYILQSHSQNGATAIAGIESGSIITTSGTYSLSSGYTIFCGMRNEIAYRDLFMHEFGHNLYDAPHYNGANGVVGEYFFSTIGWGMMGNIRSKYCALGWEKWWLGWDGIKYDIDNVNENGWYTIYDFINNGDMMRIEIPNTNQHLWLEFHSGQSVFDQRAGYLSNNFPNAPNGLFAYVENMEKDKSDISIMYDGNSDNGIKFINGNGNFDYSNSNNCVTENTWYNNCVYDFYENNNNPFSCNNDYAFIRNDYDNDNQIKYTDEKNAPSRSGGNEQEYIIKNSGSLTYEVFGENIALKPNTSYSIASNPAIFEHQKYNEVREELSPIRLHGLKLTIGNITSTYAQIHVDYGYNTVEEDVRWTGNIELPENQTITISDANVLINRTGTPSRETKDPVYGYFPYSKFSLKYNSTLNIVNYSTFVLDENSYMIVESGAKLNLTNATLEIKSGCTLELKSGSITNINNASKIIINSGGKLVYGGGSFTINSGGELIVDGAIIIDENSHFEPNIIGIVKLNGSINGEYNSSFEIDGLGKSDKALEVNNTVNITGLSNFKLKDCQVQLNPSSQLRIDDYSTNVYIDNILVTRNSTSSTKHKGIYYKSNASVTIKNSDFEYGTYGIYSYGSYTKSAIPITNCNFNYCTYGIYSNYRALNISNCDFEDCSYGWRAYNQYRTSYVTSCDFIDNSYYGIKFRGTSSSNLIVSQSVMKENISGIYFEASGNVKLSNNVITTNSRAAIEVTSGGNVYLASGYGNNTLKSNKYAVYAHNGNYIYLRDGYNNLISNTYCLYGWFFGMTGTVNANHNEWKSTRGAPVYGNEYELYSGITDGNGDYARLYVSDAYPINGNEVPNEPEEDPFDGPILDKDPYAENDFTTAELNTANFPSTPLNEAIDMILMPVETKSGKGSEDNKIELLSEILNYSFDEIDKQDQWMLDYITFRINDLALESIENKDLKIQKIIQVYNHLIKNSSKFSNSKVIRETYYDIAKADLYVINGKYYKAINILNKALKDTNKELSELINKRLCEINAEIAFVNSEILEDEIEEYVEFCSTDISNKGAVINNDENQSSGFEVIYPNLIVFPNPVTGNSEIISIIDENCSGKIKLFDITGKLIRTYELNSGENHTFIFSGEFNKGIYYVILEENNLIKEKEKIIIQ